MLEIHNFTQNEIDESFFQKIADKALKTVGIKGNTEISLAIIGDGRMRKLNKIYRGKNRVTDVLSFDNKPALPAGGSVLPYLTKAFPRLTKEQTNDFIEAPDGIKKLGEIVICYPQAKKQAKLSSHSLGKELTILLIHGILHLLEYDHEKGGEQEKEMKIMEEKIIKQVNF